MKITKQKLDIQQMDLPVVYLDEMTNEEICEQFGFRKLGNLNEGLARFKRKDGTRG